MIKRTLYFGNPAYLSLTNRQLVIRLPEVEKNDDFPVNFKKEAQLTIPIEDIGIVILDNKQLTITEALLTALIENNCAVISCNDSHMPGGMFLPLEGNTIQSERFKSQIAVTEPLRKQLWQQTAQSKIRNQAALLEKTRGDPGPLRSLAANVKTDDISNCEGTAAVYYWQHLFGPELKFYRKRDGDPPNSLLNYGYAILRAVVARGLVASGLLPTFGIHHRNRYNAYALADDIMEPYRPVVDGLVVNIVQSGADYGDLNVSNKRILLGIPAIDVMIGGEKQPADGCYAADDKFTGKVF